MLNKILNFLWITMKYIPDINEPDENIIRFSASDSISAYMNESQEQAQACIDFLCMYYDDDYFCKWYNNKLTICEYEHKWRKILIVTETKRGRPPKIRPMPHIIFKEELENPS